MPHVDTPQSTCLFGLARCDITPPVGIYHRMWGAATHDRATGIHRPLTATVLVFRNAAGPAAAETEQVLVALDLCVLWDRELKAALQRVWQIAGVEADRLLVTCSHTHASGLMGLERVELPGGDLIPPYLESLYARIADLVCEARRSVQPATITYATGKCTLAAERDYWDDAGKVFVCGFNPDEAADDTVLIARVTNAAGQTTATVVNYACHPTTLAWENTLISPDYPGAMRELVEHATCAPCIFLQGASGNLGPREGFVGEPAIADRNGRQLGYAVLAALEGMPPPATCFEYRGPVISGALLGTWSHVPLDAKQQEQFARWRVRRWTVDLAYRSEIPILNDVKQELAHWQAEEENARRAGVLQAARDCRARAERMTRWLNRLAVMPPGNKFPMPVTLWQMGDALWLAVEAEHYQLLQQALRERCRRRPLLVITLANGARCTYLPTADAYGKGIYQESIAVLERGCLERLIDEIGLQIENWRSS